MMVASGTTIHQAGEVVPAGGEYRVVNRHGRYLGRAVTCGKGERFPATEALRYEDGWIIHRAQAPDKR